MKATFTADSSERWFCAECATISAEPGVERSSGDPGWRTGLAEFFENGALLDAAGGTGFDVLITCDQHMLQQQNLTGHKLAAVVLSTNHWSTLRPVAARIATKVNFVQHGQVMKVDVAAF